MKIVGLDSSGLVASVAVVEDGNLLAEYTVNYKKTHSQTLLPMLDEIARMIELDLQSVDAIAVAGGPGSFTGLRIGSATAKGLGLALGKPLIQVPTVDGLAYNLWGARGLVCPLMDARRNQTYTGLYSFGEEGMEILIPQCAVGIDEIIQQVNQFEQEVVFLGDGVPVFRDYIQEHCMVPYSFAPAHLNKQRAAAVAVLGQEYYRRGRLQTAAEHCPEYLRLSQAERERLAAERRQTEASVEIRPLKPEDADAAARLEADIFTKPWSRQGFLDALAVGNTMFFAAVRQEELLGYCGMYCGADEGEITNVAVAAPFRRQGIGSALLDRLLSESRSAGIHNVVLEVRVSNEKAIHLYQKKGFTVSGIRKNFYESPIEDGYVMVRSQ